ncbi:MAG: sensor histidine kinase KdpD [Bacteroidales bacterium]|nr:sensor histidine kinase KdpD [Bacteroidales bacterium]
MNTFEEKRPDPDEILASLKLEEEKSKRGKLKIFFGMCAGVGKTFTMLQSAKTEKLKGTDVVIGYIETHHRKETEDLVRGLEVIPRKSYEYKGTSIQEADLDAVIVRKPQVVLIDELAHTNAPGSRHLKRYQDVMDILDNGIDVFTTLNVQHIESRSDTVAQITGIGVRETVPDEIFEKADEIVLVDITPDELLARFAEGKVYTPERSQEAVHNFFRKGNITALREMALRIAADRVDIQLRQYMQHKHIPGPWKSGMHLMVSIGPSPHSAKLLRWSKNLSYTMGATLLALYVESPRKLTVAQEEQLNKNINLAKQLGAEFRTISGDDLVKAILNAAQKENITHIILGKPRHRNMFSLFKLGNLVNRLIRLSGNIDIYVLGSDLPGDDKYRRKIPILSFSSGFSQYLLAGIITILTAIACYPARDIIGYQVVAFALLFEVSILAIFLGIGPILLSATLSALLWDYLFIPPSFTLHIGKPEDVLMLFMYFIIVMLNGILTSRVRRQERMTRDREERTRALYQLTMELSSASGIDEVLKVSVKDIQKFFKIASAIILNSGQKELDKEIRHESELMLSDAEFSIASWTFHHSRKAGKFTDTLPSTSYTFYPLHGTRHNIGVIAVRQNKAFKGDEEIFWDTFRTQISDALEREFLNELALKALILDESDKLYKTLFNSISHELRIPLATIMGATDTLLSADYDKQTYTQLFREIFMASERLNRLIENLLNMSRLESGRITPHMDWLDVHDLLNKVTKSLASELEHFNLEIVIPDDIPLIRLDFGLMEQVLHNLVFNATQYAPHKTTIRVKMYYEKPHFVMQVMDRGPGFPKDAIPYVFNKFYRLAGTQTGGTGLGLSIVKGFVEAHNGTIEIESRKNGGARITVRIPSEVPDLGQMQYK